MLHSPLFFVWIGWVLVVGVIAAVGGVHARREVLQYVPMKSTLAIDVVGRRHCLETSVLWVCRSGSSGPVQGGCQTEREWSLWQGIHSGIYL